MKEAKRICFVNDFKVNGTTDFFDAAHMVKLSFDSRSIDDRMKEVHNLCG